MGLPLFTMQGLMFVDGAGDSSFWDGTVQTKYFISAYDSSFFVGLGFGMGWASAHIAGNEDRFSSDDNAGGMLGSASMGMRFFRTSDVNGAIELRYAYLFKETKISMKNPGLLSLFLVIYR